MNKVSSKLFDRRRVLGAGLALLGSAALPRMSFAAAPSELGSNLLLINDVGANVLALRTSAGVVLVDSGVAESTSTLLEHLNAVGDAKVSTLFNTHWHAEQTGGNVTFGERGAEIIAHAKARAHLATEYYVPHEERYHRPLPKEGIPTTTFYTSESRTIGDQHVEFGYLRQAHTDGDIYVFLRDANVLAVGDVASPEKDPSLDWYGGGWLGGRVDAMDLVLSLADERTRIVPAQGAVMSRAEFQAERDLMAFLYERTVELMREGKSAQDMLAGGLMDNLPRRFSDPGRFLYDNYKGLWAHHNKLAPNVV